MREKLPVMIGHHLKKGLLVLRNTRMGGFDLVILWLNRDCESGQEYDFSDIKKVDTVLHFCDEESVDQTMNALSWMKKS